MMLQLVIAFIFGVAIGYVATKSRSQIGTLQAICARYRLHRDNHADSPPNVLIPPGVRGQKIWNDAAKKFYEDVVAAEFSGMTLDVFMTD